MDLERALAYAEEMHRGQLRKQGTDYISHPLRVMEILRDQGRDQEDYLVTALFHDLLEDTQASREEIEAYGSPEVYRLVLLLSKEEGYDKGEYIRRIQADPVARLVKVADRIANLEETVFLGADQLDFMARYIGSTEDYYLDLARGTSLEARMKEALEDLRDHYLGLEDLRKT